MLDRLQLHLKKKMRIGLYIFLIFFSFESTAALELGKNTPQNLIINSGNKNSTVSAAPESEEINIDEPEKIGVVASVNGDPITVMDVLEVCGLEESRLPYIYKGAQLQEEAEKLRLKALDEVIDRKLVYQEFKEKGYQLPKNFVEDNLDRLMLSFNVNDRGELEKLLKKHGSTMDEFRKKAYENAAVDLLINEKCYIDVYITPEYVYDYYIRHKSFYTSQVQIRLQVLKLKTDGIHKDELNTISTHLEKILKDRNSNEFADSIFLYNEGPKIEDSVEIECIDKSKLREAFLELEQEADSGDIIGPIKAKDAYYFLCNNNIYMTPEYIYDYYTKHKGDFASPEQMREQMLKLKTDGDNEDELSAISTHLGRVLKYRNSNEFADAVLLYSEGPNIEHGGDIGWIIKSKLRKDFLAFLKGSDSGDIVGPIKSEEAFYLLRVADIRREKTQSFEQVKKGIKDSLTKDRIKKAYKAYIDGLRSKAYIKKYL